MLGMQRVDFGRRDHDSREALNKSAAVEKFNKQRTGY
jgi:hypothetical protein